MSPRNGLRLAALCLALTGAVQLAGAASIQAKAALAPVLIERAWAQSLAAGEVGFKPWPWADTFPVARLSLSSLGVSFLVLEGDSGNALAFGPGMREIPEQDEAPTTFIISAHRDTHFTVLKDLAVGDRVAVEQADGGSLSFEVVRISVVDGSPVRLRSSSPHRTLLLVTCYPFGSLALNSDQRYIVEATETVNVSIPNSLGGPLAGDGFIKVPGGRDNGRGDI
jgi:sortase A